MCREGSVKRLFLNIFVENIQQSYEGSAAVLGAGAFKGISVSSCRFYDIPPSFDALCLLPLWMFDCNCCWVLGGCKSVCLFVCCSIVFGRLRSKQVFFFISVSRCDGARTLFPTQNFCSLPFCFDGFFLLDDWPLLSLLPLVSWHKASSCKLQRWKEGFFLCQYTPACLKQKKEASL